MLNSIIRFSLTHRLLVICCCLAIIVIGSVVSQTLPIDVLPDLTRPRVTVITECHGFAPEEVEQLVTYPLESAINGANGVVAVRSTSDIGLSLVTAEFDWGTDIYVARQIVQERIATVLGQLPPDLQPQLGPISSLLGQIMIIGMYSESGETPPMEIRTLADWIVRKRLQAIPGVSQVIVMGGGRKQYHVLVDAEKLRRFGVTLQDVEAALRDSNINVTGGYVDRNANELLVRGLGRLDNIEQLDKVVVKNVSPRPILLAQVARVQAAPQPPRGDSSVNGRPAVVLTIQKQPQADTRHLTDQIAQALLDLKPILPPDVQMSVTYQQRSFIDHSVDNVVEALRDGAILVVIVLFVFLLNLRTTFITLTAIPVSLLVTVLCFRFFDMSINVMTLGGLAVALGELVDDAIVDVENIFRRLKKNAQLESPRPVIQVVFEASVEVRSAIIISTMLVIAVFAPLFALTGMEGRLFVPLAVAYIVSILASTVVSLTLTPVLSYYLLPKAKATVANRDGLVMRSLKKVVTPCIRFSMDPFGFGVILTGLVSAVVVVGILFSSIGRDFLPDFDEGAAQVNLFTQPGTSLATSREISRLADKQLETLLKSDENPQGPLLFFTCRTGRAEQDEHVMGVNVSEYVMTLNSDSGLSREQTIEKLHEVLDSVPGVQVEVEQPIAHLISHMLSGVTAQIAIKIYGDDLETLRRKAGEVEAAIQDVPGIAPPFVEQQVQIPQLQIELIPARLADYGLTVRDVSDIIETALSGRLVSRMQEGQRYFDIVLRFDEGDRRDFDELKRLPIELHDGALIPLSAVANVREGAGPNAINRENGQRRIVVRVNTMGRDLGSAVQEIQNRVSQQESELRAAGNGQNNDDYSIAYGGQFEAQETATRRIQWMSAVALVVVFVILYSAYPSVSIVLQILTALPVAFLGGVVALWLSGESMSVASLVGFISLAGIAARNGLLLVSTYLNLIPSRGFNAQMVLEGSLERLTPVMMTGLTTGIGLVPIVVGGHMPGKEILFPIAIVMIGGLVTSTLGEFLIRPGLFLLCSKKPAIRILSKRQDQDFKEDQSNAVVSADA